MHSPLFDSVALVSMEDVFIWLHTEKITPELLLHLQPKNCETERYVTFK